MDDSQVNSKYDRQIRLWNSSGQSSISNASLLVINTSASIVETIKNLVLPGLGKIVLFDNSLVNCDDLSNIFFLTEEDHGKRKDQCLAVKLNELNPDVSVSSCDVSIAKSVSDLVQNIDYLTQFDCILIDSYMPELIDTLYLAEIPIIHVKSYGFYSMLKIYIKENKIIDTHFANLDDLRLDEPWDELLEYIESLKIDTLDELQFSKIPYSLILTKLVHDFKENNNQTKPTTKELRTAINKLRRSGDEANLDEAYNRAFKVNTKSSHLPDNLLKIFDELKLRPLEEIKKDKFWVLVYGLNQFYEDYKTLPISGVLPDMESDTQQYINLQKIYRNKFELDKSRILKEIQKLGDGLPEIADSDLTLLTKNARYIRLQMNSKEVFNPTLNTSRDYNIYLGFLAVEEFKNLHNGKFPDLRIDSAELRSIMISKLCSYKIDAFPEGLDKILDEFLRSSGKELHNIASIIGGITSQEIIKLITHQYIALEDSLVFDGIQSRTISWKT